MNRMQSRFIAAFIGVILLVVFFTFLVSHLARYFAISPMDGEMALFIDSLPPETQEQFTNALRQALPRQIVLFTLLSGGVAILAGIWLARSFAAPLDQLATSVRAFSSRNLSHRVPVTGTEEVQEVAVAFNEIAAQLEGAENRRRDLLADVAHELRTPVTVIQGNLRAILDDVYPLDKEEVARLYEQTLFLSRLIEDLRQLAQAEADQLQLTCVQVNVANLAKEATAVLQPLAAARKIDLHVELLGALPVIEADQARLQQALHNLIGNALRYTPDSGKVIVVVEQVHDELQIRVQDNGEGIAAAHLPHVFDRFYRADPSRSRESGGSGLGLAIVRAIARAHGGRATAVSPGPGQGSTFTLHLPLTQKR
jgi:signal transduction histidine kinase